MAKGKDIENSIKEQIKILDKLSRDNNAIKDSIESLTKSLTTYIEKNRHNIDDLSEANDLLKKFITEFKSSKTIFNDTLKQIITIVSEIEKFSEKVHKINEKISKLKDISEKINVEQLKNFDMSPVLDFFGELGKKLSTSKLTRLNNYLNKIDETAIYTVADDLSKFNMGSSIGFFKNLSSALSKKNLDKIVNSISKMDYSGIDILNEYVKSFTISPVVSLINNINRNFSTDKMNKLVNKLSKMGVGDDFKLVTMYLKDVDKFISESIKYLNKMVSKIKDYVNKQQKLEVDDAVWGKDKKKGLGGIYGAGASISFIYSQFPEIVNLFGGIRLFALGLKDSFSRIFKSIDLMFSNVFSKIATNIKIKMREKFENAPGWMQKLGNVGKGLIGVLGGVTLAFGVLVAGLVMGLRYMMKGAEEARRMRLEAAKEYKLNELFFLRSSASGIASPGGIISRFAGADEETIIRSRAAMLARFGGSELLGGMTGTQAKNMSIMSSMLDISIDKMAELYDVMQNIHGLEPNTYFIDTINKHGILANRVIKDMSENMNEFMLYGERAFQNLSSLSNKLFLNMKSATGIVEKFSTVSGAIDTAYKLTLVTGRFMNPLTQFMQYTYGDPSKIIEDVMNRMGDFSKMNRQAKKFAADALGMSVSELEISANKYRTMREKGMGEQEFNRTYKSIDDVVSNLGFQRLLGGFSRLLDLIEKEVTRGYFQKFSMWLEKRGTNIVNDIEYAVKLIRDKVVPFIIDLFSAIGKGIITVLNWIPGAIEDNNAKRLIKGIDEGASFLKRSVGSQSESSGRYSSSSMITVPREQTQKTESTINVNDIMGKKITPSENSTFPESLKGEKTAKLDNHINIYLDSYKLGQALTETALSIG